MTPAEQNSWLEYKRFLVESLGRVERDLADCRSELIAVRLQLQGLKIRVAGISTALAIGSSLLVKFFIH